MWGGESCTDRQQSRGPSGNFRAGRARAELRKQRDQEDVAPALQLPSSVNPPPSALPIHVDDDDCRGLKNAEGAPKHTFITESAYFKSPLPTTDPSMS